MTDLASCLELKEEDAYSYEGSINGAKENVENGSLKQRAYFTSNTVNTYIRNASTGVQYPFKVGSTESRRLFKIVDTIGIYDVNGRKPFQPKRRNKKVLLSKITHDLPNPNPNHLYYDTPEECVRHFKDKQRVTLDLNPDFVNQWHEQNKE
jgi:hypothetical protein